LRFTPGQRQVHPRVRIEQRERKHFRIEAEFPGDDLKWWGIGDLPVLVWFNGMARHAAGLRQTLAVIGASGRAPLEQAGLREAASKIEAIASFLRPHFGHPFEPYIPHRVLPRSAHWTKWLGSVTGCGHRRDRKCRGTPKRAGGTIVHSAGAAR
jgi:hypothetical protein